MEVTAEKLEALFRASSLDGVNGCTIATAVDSEPEEEALVVPEEAAAGDAMLGTIQRGLNSISTHAKEYMDTCKTDENRKNMQNKLESSMLGLLKSEQIVKELPLLVTHVVDKFVDDMDEEEEKDEGPLACFKPLLQLNEVRMGAMSQKICELFDEKVKEFEKSLTDEKLKQLPTFTALEGQVAEAVKEASINEGAIVAAGSGDAPEIDLSEFIEEGIKYHDPEELSDDELMLPTIDPISKEPMMNPVRNKYCNHVFEEQSVFNYIRTSSDPLCPLDYCQNDRPFRREHFVKVPKLTEQVRRKNMRGNEGIRPQPIKM